MFKKEKFIENVMNVEGEQWMGFVIDDYSFCLVNRAKEYSMPFEYVGEIEEDGVLYCGVELTTGEERMYYVENDKKMIMQNTIENEKEVLMLIEVINKKYIKQEKIPIEKIKVFFELFG